MSSNPTNEASYSDPSEPTAEEHSAHQPFHRAHPSQMPRIHAPVPMPAYVWPQPAYHHGYIRPGMPMTAMPGPRMGSPASPGSPPVQYAQYYGVVPIAPQYGYPAPPVSRPRSMSPKKTLGPAIQTSTKRSGPPGANLFVFHVPQSMSNAELFHLFSQFGAVLSSRIVWDRVSGRSRGFGFVSFSSVEPAAAAIAGLNGFRLGHKRLEVTYTREDQEFVRSQRPVVAAAAAPAAAPAPAPAAGSATPTPGGGGEEPQPASVPAAPVAGAGSPPGTPESPVAVDTLADSDTPMAAESPTATALSPSLP